MFAQSRGRSASIPPVAIGLEPCLALRLQRKWWEQQGLCGPQLYLMLCARGQMRLQSGQYVVDCSVALDRDHPVVAGQQLRPWRSLCLKIAVSIPFRT